jgi:hypothetical protein
LAFVAAVLRSGHAWPKAILTSSSILLDLAGSCSVDFPSSCLPELLTWRSAQRNGCLPFRRRPPSSSRRSITLRLDTRPPDISSFPHRLRRQRCFTRCQLFREEFGKSWAGEWWAGESKP